MALNQYLHGTYGAFSPSIGAVPVKSGTVAVYVGTAPANLVRGYADKGVVNEPVKISNLSDAQNTLGYSDDWNTFTLCEAIKAHFDNSLGNVGPVVFINVLNPATHKKSGSQSNVTFANGQAIIVSDKIILDTLVLTGKTEGKDYQMSYDYNLKRVVLTSDTLDGEVAITYSEVDTSNIDETTIIGKATNTGEFEGLGAVNLIYTKLNMIPNILAAPGWSDKKEVYAAMLKTATKINGHWEAFVNADMNVTAVTQVDTIEKAIKWAADNGYKDEKSKVYWPQWKADNGEIYHLSTLATWGMMKTDQENGDVPMESVSNKQIPFGKLYFGEESKNKGYDQQTANELNKKGITTATFWGGINVLWGPHTAAYDYDGITDNRAIFESSIRTMMHIINSFQAEWGTVIDEPMTLSLAETIRNREQEKVDGLKAMGALIGDPVVEFIETENPIDNLVQGDFVWSSRITATPPFKSGTMKVAYTTEGFNAYYGGEA